VCMDLYDSVEIIGIESIDCFPFRAVTVVGYVNIF
jgi:hypothetical protein